jgi:catechol 2,3-dioxygenase-like lactoylglutathione lyase family enzyme
MTATAHVPPPTSGFRPTEYAHIVLKTAQADALVEWYGMVLGAQPAVRTPFITFLTWDDSQDRLALIPIAEAVAPPPNATGLHHAAFSIGSLAALCQQYRVLKAKGIVPLRAMNHGVATSMYYADPDGNEIELTVEAFASVDELNAWFATGAFDINPVGVVVDPDELCRRIDAGEAEADILQPHPDHLTWLADQLRAPVEVDRGTR